MSTVEEMLESFCEFCDQDPANCFNLGYCPYEEDYVDESQQ